MMVGFGVVVVQWGWVFVDVLVVIEIVILMLDGG